MSENSFNYQHFNLIYDIIFMVFVRLFMRDFVTGIGPHIVVYILCKSLKIFIF